jgi:hypothetical protein
MDQSTLRGRLQQWKDIEAAAFDLAVILGLWQDPTNYSTTLKHVFWTNNSVINTLLRTLDAMVTAGMLEKRDTEEDPEYRWNPEFKGSWETK